MSQWNNERRLVLLHLQTSYTLLDSTAHLAADPKNKPYTCVVIWKETYILQREHISLRNVLPRTCEPMQVDSLPAEPPRNPKNTGVGSLSLLQRVFTTQELNRGLLHFRQILYQGSPILWPNSVNWDLPICHQIQKSAFGVPKLIPFSLKTSDIPHGMGPRIWNWLEMWTSFSLMTGIPFVLHADCKAFIPSLTRDVFGGECDEDSKVWYLMAPQAACTNVLI